jgi:hypothetical protein
VRINYAVARLDNVLKALETTVLIGLVGKHGIEFELAGDAAPGFGRTVGDHEFLFLLFVMMVIVVAARTVYMSMVVTMIVSVRATGSVHMCRLGFVFVIVIM